MGYYRRYVIMVDRSHPWLSRAEILSYAKQSIDPWHPAAAQEIELIARAHVKHMRSIAGARSLEEARGRLQHAIHSQACRVVAAICSWKGETQPLRYFQEVADEANLRKSQIGVLVVKVVEKAEGGRRPISNFNHVDGAKQLLLREILLAKFGYSMFEHARAGRGRDTVLQEILLSLEKGDKPNLIEADIKDCFPSVNRSALSAILKLPKSVVRNTVGIGPNTSISIRNNEHHHISTNHVRAGLPQGSRVSVLIMSLLIEKVLRQLDDPMAASYINNLWAGPINEAEAAAKIDALRKLFRQHPAGPFTLRYANVITINSYNDVLGYWVRRQTPGFPGIVRVTPSPWAMHKAQKRLGRRLSFITPGTVMDGVIDDWAARWCNSLALWLGRKNGQTLAFMDGYDHVWHHQKRFRHAYAGVKFSSFADLRRAADDFADLLPLNPHYRPLGWREKSSSVPAH